MRNRWYHKPILHTSLSPHEKRPSWLELFYDLVFVAAFIQLGNGLSNHVNVEGAVTFVATFVPMWIAWTGYTFYSNRFDVDDFLHRITVFVQMFAIGAMAIFVPDVLENKPHNFAIAYAVAQLIVALLYLRSYYQEREGQGFSKYWGTVFAIGSGLWFVSAFLPTPWCYVLWALGIIAIIAAPFSKHSRALAESAPYDLHHLTERYGILTIIVLGESFVKVLSSLGDLGSDNLVLLGQASFTLLITCCVWWIYFDDIAGSKIKNARFSFVVWLYGHIPIHAAIVATGVAIKKAVHFDLMVPAPTKYRLLLAISLGVVFLGTAIVDSVTERKQAELSDRFRVIVRTGSSVLIVLVAAVGFTMPAWLFLGFVTVVCLGQVVFDMFMAPIEAIDENHHIPTVRELYEKAKEDDILPGQQPRINIEGSITKGAPNELRRDFYFYLMEGSWVRVFAILAFLFVIINVFFAAIYSLDPGAITNARPSSFADAFYFSVQTMSTIGYGRLNPVTDYGNLVVTIQAATSILFVALATGLMFAKASRPKASILFSDKMVVSKYDGQTNLIFRAGNAKGNDIIDATMSLYVLRDEMSPEGHHLRRLHDLKLTRQRTPFFRFSWVLMHVIDDTSPLKDVDWAAPEAHIQSIMATLTGHDGTYGQTTYARHAYHSNDIISGHQFVDVISQLPDGRLVIDYTKFHDTVPDSNI